MSIFGDTAIDAALSPSPDPDIENDSHFIEHTIDVNSAQQRRDFHTFVEDELEDFDPDYSSPGVGPQAQDYAKQEEEEEEVPYRPNRFEGTAAQWKKFTSEERALISSLDEIRAGNLSLHLYNAHSLDSRLASSAGDEHEDAYLETNPPPSNSRKRKWMSEKTWTAWPMGLDLVPHRYEQPGKSLEDGSELNHLGSDHHDPSSDEIYEQVLALLQKHAKQQWASRGGLINPSDAEISSSETDINKQSHFVVLADDEESRTILHPTVRSVLAKLDQLLLGLHHSRIGQSIVSEDTKLTGDHNEEHAVAEPIGTAQKLSAGRRSRDGVNIRKVSAKSESRSPSKGGRPRLYQDKRPDETHYHMLKRLSIEKSQAQGALDGPSTEQLRRIPGERHYQLYKRRAQLALPTRSPDPAKTSPKMDTRRPNLSNRIPRDWSEVFGMATRQNFSNVAIQRAARRFEEWFGERMEFQSVGNAWTCDQAALTDGTTLIPVPHSEIYSNDAEQRLKCPLSTCPRNGHRFADKKTRDRHVAETHGPDVLEQYAPEKILAGGVHQDEFLQIIPRLVGAGQTYKHPSR